MIDVLKGQQLPIMNAVMVSLSLHALAGWAFLNIAHDITHHTVVPPMEFFVVPPPSPERETAIAPRIAAKPVQKNTAIRHVQVPLPAPAIATRPLIASSAVPGQPKQKAETAPPSLVTPIAAVSQTKISPPFHSVPLAATASAVHVTPRAQAASRSTTGTADTNTVIAPGYGAAYLHNPSPPYPPVARKLRLQGTVIVKVFVSPDGEPKSVELENSSGVRVLDDAAVEAVKLWSFVPARRGTVHVAAWVYVPIRFHLE